MWHGRPRAALRSYQEVLLHSDDPAKIDVARVGIWVASANVLNLADFEKQFEILAKLDDEMISLWDAPVHTAGLRWGR